ncbi:hypothetical protein CDD80_6930 [Ophiocordyceps camponoti-rufipedis]|uniref:Uncharacterized protein n=1 Tax=Ophiocordyceps camponoti-rufipedis TaxID=2004952 RepID=A0A2C5Z980_9HYPO|nr:hypothetical protein CDD80_6930 [Ophiocordyceps camponoti-rufipedis]
MKTTSFSTAILLTLATLATSLPNPQASTLPDHQDPNPSQSSQEMFKIALANRRKLKWNIPDEDEMDVWYPGITDYYKGVCKKAVPEWERIRAIYWSCFRMQLGRHWATQTKPKKMVDLRRFTNEERWPARLETLRAMDDPTSTTYVRLEAEEEAGGR